MLHLLCIIGPGKTSEHIGESGRCHVIFMSSLFFQSLIQAPLKSIEINGLSFTSVSFELVPSLLVMSGVHDESWRHFDRAVGDNCAFDF